MPLCTNLRVEDFMTQEYGTKIQKRDYAYNTNMNYFGKYYFLWK